MLGQWIFFHLPVIGLYLHSAEKINRVKSVIQILISKKQKIKLLSPSLNAAVGGPIMFTVTVIKSEVLINQLIIFPVKTFDGSSSTKLNIYWFSFALFGSIEFICNNWTKQTL